MARQKIISFFLIFAATAFLAGAAFADVYVYKDKNGMLTFTNTPNHAGYRRVLRESRGEGSGHTSVNPSYDELIQTASGRYNIDAELIRAVIKAVLLDPEARAGDDPAFTEPDVFGRFRDAVNFGFGRNWSGIHWRSDAAVWNR